MQSNYATNSTNAFTAAFKKKPINPQYQSEQDPKKLAEQAFLKKRYPSTPTNAGRSAGSGRTGAAAGSVAPGSTMPKTAPVVAKPAPVVAPATGGIKGPSGEMPPSTSSGRTDTGAIGTPVDVNAQSQQLKALADQMATARTAGDMGTLNTLTAQYSTLVQSMQKQVAAAPETGVTGQTATPAEQQTATPAEQQQYQALLAAKKTAESTGATLPADQAALLAQLQAKTTGRQQGAPTGSPPAPGAGVASPEGGSQDTGGPGAGQAAATTGAKQQEYEANIAKENQSYEGMKNKILNDPNLNQTQKDLGLKALEKTHNAAVNQLNSTWESQGKYEDQLQTLINTPVPGSTVKITDLPETLQNEFYREAMDALKNGKDPNDLVADYLSFFDQNPDFSLKPAGYEEKTKDIHDYTKTAAPGVTELGAADTSGITGALAKATQTDAGNKAMMMSLDALTKRLQGGGALTDQDFSSAFALIDAETAANVSAASHDLANAGQSQSGTTPQQLAAIRQQGTDKKGALIKEMLSKQMEVNQMDFQQSVQQLTGIAKDEADRLVAERGQDITAQTSSTELQTKREELSKTLFQEGQLTIYSTQVEEGLKAYGMSLTKYQTDKGFDEAGLDRDLKERIAEQGGTIEEQKLKYQQVKDSIEFAQTERQDDDKRNAQIAELEQKAAQGDQDANFKIQSLRVEQDLRDRGMTNEQARFNGNLMYYLLNNREERSQELLMFYEGLKAQKEMQGSGFLDFLGQFVGDAAAVAVAAL